MPKKQKAKIKQKNKCPEKLIRTEAAKEIAEIDRSLQDQKYQLRCRAAIDLLTAKLNMINADLSRKKRHVVINQISSRVKTAESIYTIGLFLQLIFGKAATAIRALETLLDWVENQIAAARRTFERNDLAHPSSLSL